jgi:hypothetical protein
MNTVSLDCRDQVAGWHRHRWIWESIEDASRGQKNDRQRDYHNASEFFGRPSGVDSESTAFVERARGACLVGLLPSTETANVLRDVEQPLCGDRIGHNP